MLLNVQPEMVLVDRLTEALALLRFFSEECANRRSGQAVERNWLILGVSVLF